MVKNVFLHGNKDRKPIHTTPIEVKQTIIDLYLNKYYSCNFVHFTELLSEHEHINLSSSTVSSILSDEFIVSPRADRKIDAGHCVKFDKKYYKPVDCRNIPVYYHKGTKALIIKAFNGELFVTIHEKVYALEEILNHESKSKFFDTISTEIKPKEKYIPPMNHPWRIASFKKYIDKQSHRTEKSA